MTYNSSINLNVTNNLSGYSISGNNAQLTVLSGDIRFEGNGQISDGDLLIGSTSENAFVKSRLNFIKSITVENPASGDKIPIFFNESGFTLQKIKSSVWNTGVALPSVTYSITQSMSRSGTTTPIAASFTETGYTTGTTRIAFSNSTISGSSYVFFECTAASGVTDIHVSLIH